MSTIAMTTPKPADVPVLVVLAYRLAASAVCKAWMAVLIFIVSVAIGYQAAPLPAGISAVTAFLGIALGSNMLYSAMLSEQIEPICGRSGARQVVTHGLLAMFFGLAAFFLVLFLMIFSVILVAVSGYDPTASDASDVDASLAALRHSGAIWLLYMLVAAAGAVLLWFAVRLVLAGPETVAHGRVRVFRSWGRTRGHVLRIFSTLIVALVPVCALLWLGKFVAMDGVGGAILLAIIWLPAIFVLHGVCAAIHKTLPALEDPAPESVSAA